MKNKRKRAVSLIEVMIVMVVLGILVTTMWFILSPIAKRKGLEARITSDLKQINMAIQIYKIDHDDKYPLSLESMPELSQILANTPQIPDGSPLKGGQQGRCLYNYTMSRPAQLIMIHRPVPLTYDPSKHYIALYPCYMKEQSGESYILAQNFDREWIQFPTSPIRKNLAVYEDGHVEWSDYEDDWLSIQLFYGASIFKEYLEEKNQ